MGSIVKISEGVPLLVSKGIRSKWRELKIHAPKSIGGACPYVNCSMIAFHNQNGNWTLAFAFVKSICFN
ncbi:unnamed protein product [Cuscuta campestris]|uniref:Uncharacterized protein n=1 Tax=Cuscuta campestris TaxID=132261 RepID=A0A484K968_9ASTE|nr:unnamed protein product [Cuscuta campestris]